MPVTRLEALVDALAKVQGFDSPDSESYQLRSPLLILSFARPGRHEVDAKGRRVFPSLISGYRAALFDIELKVSGKSRAGLKPDDTLPAIMGVYGLSDPDYVKRVVNFLKRALGDSAISANTPLSYFLQK